MQLNRAEPMPEGEPIARTYLYCIIEADKPLTFAAPGVGYERTKRNMTAHMKALEEVMRAHTILPIRFNSVSPNAESVREDVLVPGVDSLKARLARIDGHVEMGVKALWREDVLYEEIVAVHDDIRRLRDRVEGRPPEATYRERLRLGEMRQGDPAPRLVLDAAYLVETGRADAFHAAAPRTGLALSDLLDRILNRGVAVVGDLTSSIAKVDLIYVGLKVLLSSVETAEELRPLSKGASHAVSLRDR